MHHLSHAQDTPRYYLTEGRRVLSVQELTGDQTENVAIDTSAGTVITGASLDSLSSSEITTYASSVKLKVI